MAGFGGDSPLRGDAAESTAAGKKCMLEGRIYRCYATHMELDEASLAIGRIERALSRMEKALTDRAARPAPAPVVTATALPPADQSALKAEVAAVIGELDRLIAEAERG